MNTSPAKTRRVSPASTLAAICAVPLVAAPLVLAVTPAAQTSVSSVALNNRVLTVQANNTPTSVRIQHSGANTVVTQAGVNGSWTYPTANVQRVVFNGGSDNDSFDATGLTLPVLAKGNGETTNSLAATHVTRSLGQPEPTSSTAAPRTTPGDD